MALLSLPAPISLIGCIGCLVSFKLNTMMLRRLRNHIFESISEEVLARVHTKETAHEVWKELKNINVGSKKVREEQYELLKDRLNEFKMLPYELVEQMYSRLNMLIEDINTLDIATISEAEIIRKILHTLPKPKYNIIKALLFKKYLRTLEVFKVVGKIRSHEMFLMGEIEPSTSKKDLALKAKEEPKTKKKSKPKPPPSSSESEASSDGSGDDEDEDAQLALMMRKTTKMLSSYDCLSYDCPKHDKKIHKNNRRKDEEEEEEDKDHKYKKKNQSKSKMYNKNSGGDRSFLVNEWLTYCETSSEESSDDEDKKFAGPAIMDDEELPLLPPPMCFMAKSGNKVSNDKSDSSDSDNDLSPNELRSLLEDYNDMIKKQRAKIKVLEETYAKLKHSNDELLISHKDLSNDHDALIVSNKSLRDDHDKLLGRLNELIFKHDEVVVLNKSLESSYKKLKVEHDSLKVKYQELEFSYDAIDPSVQEIARDVTKVNYKAGGSHWVLDSECTPHMTGYVRMFTSLDEDAGDHEQVPFGDNSIGKESKEVVFKGFRHGNIYFVDFTSHEVNLMTCLFTKTSLGLLWYRHIAHIGMSQLKKAFKKGMVVGVKDVKFEKDKLCSACQAGKQVASHHSLKAFLSTSRPLELLHMDLFYPTTYKSLGEDKSKIVGIFKTFTKRAQNEFESTIVKSSNSKAYRVFNNATRIIEETYGVEFDESNGSQGDGFAFDDVGNEPLRDVMKKMAIGDIKPMEEDEAPTTTSKQVEASPKDETKDEDVPTTSHHYDVSSDEDDEPARHTSSTPPSQDEPPSSQDIPITQEEP
ncbi:uncharacterized protein LOC106804531 [Setaria italica]|uniref:uncharacterized protein LOC106804531 n=1 Tax=Setaria italica TaxID=4555 RepID=UPI0007199FD5|nr:uncharacterized protein LOC106804531 [Setaria italica]